MHSSLTSCSLKVDLNNKTRSTSDVLTNTGFACKDRKLQRHSFENVKEVSQCNRKRNPGVWYRRLIT